MTNIAAVPCADARERARRLVLAHGWNTTCYQILNPGIDLWFSKAEDAVIGYVSRNGVRVVAGAPVCAEARLNGVLDEWHADCERLRQRVCYFGAEERVGAALKDQPGFSSVVLGAQPVWSPNSFIDAPVEDKSLRYQLNRARNKKVRVIEWPSSAARGNLELKRCLRQWLAGRGLPPLHFLVEPHTLDHLMDRRLFVAERMGEPVGFVVLAPVPSRNGWLTEQFVRGSAAPNGTVELSLSEAIEKVCLDAGEFVTMGIVPLSSHGFGSDRDNPTWLKLLLAWVRAHGRRFYDFDGLDRFKSKFHPDSWEPIYAISTEPNFSFGTLYAIAAAFSEGPPWLAVLRGLGRAVRQELQWMVGKGKEKRQETRGKRHQSIRNGRGTQQIGI